MTKTVRVAHNHVRLLVFMPSDKCHARANVITCPTAHLLARCDELYIGASNLCGFDCIAQLVYPYLSALLPAKHASDWENSNEKR